MKEKTGVCAGIKKHKSMNFTILNINENSSYIKNTLSSKFSYLVYKEMCPFYF